MSGPLWPGNIGNAMGFMGGFLGRPSWMTPDRAPPLLLGTLWYRNQILENITRGEALA
jgi:hypothetical protein